MHAEMLIDGCFVGGPCDQSVGKQVLRSPFDGKIIGTAAEGGWSELRASIDAADSAFLEWRSSPRLLRQQVLRRTAELIRERTEELAELLVLEIGKPITAARGEVARTAITFDCAADLVGHHGMEALAVDLDPRGSDYRCTVERFPIGVIFCIVPYNWPLNLSAHKIAPALAAGNSVIVKPSPLAPICTMTLVRILHEAGCPPGVVNLWNGHPTLAQRALEDRRVKMLSFTGSAAVGWSLKEKVSDRRVCLVLGGDASVIVYEDADLDWATARTVAGGFGYAGQICISIQHVLVQESIYEDFKARLIAATTECPTGDPKVAETVCGPLISSEAADKVMAMIDEAVSKGATLLAGGTRSGNIISPTILESVPQSVALANEEVFGPVLTLSKFQSSGEALAKVNSSKYGIQCGVFTRSSVTAESAYRALEVGGVVINDYPTLRFDNMPYGGVKASGFGREGVRYAMDEMTEPKTRVERIV